MDIKVRLGQEAFVAVTACGGVERTMIGALKADHYMFLNGLHSTRSHWFDFDQARVSAERRIKEREKELRAELKALAQRRKHLMSKEYETEVLSSDYKVVDLQPDGQRKRSKRLKEVRLPEYYLRPGCRVYVVITPETSSPGFEYRPYPYFVLETEVSGAYLSSSGVVNYMFTTPFEVRETCSLKDEAIQKLRSCSGLGALEPVPFVSQEEEKLELYKLDDIPF